MQRRDRDDAGFPPSRERRWAWAVAVASSLVLAACGSAPKRAGESTVARPSPSPSAPPTASTPPRKSGGYYLDDGPGDAPPPNLDLVPDAVPRVEKYASGANRPYNVFGVDYVPDLTGAPYRQRGTGSWYGRKFHGQRTSSGEIYDMYAMTAAHPTLPIPCFALVTNLVNGKSVIVRVNDRGPFLHNRIMDLSYAAALKVGYLSSGSGQIEVEMLMPADIAAGRIPITTNSVYVASVANGGPRSPLAVARGSAPALPPPVALDAITTTVAIAPSSGAATPSSTVSLPPSTLLPPPTEATRPSDAPLAATYAERGIPADLIPDAQPPARLPEVATSTGFFLQLGAFRARAGADSFAAHVTREIDPAIASKVHVAEIAGLFRVRIGPYPRRADADSAATNLRAAIAQPVLVMPEGSLR